MRLRWIVILVLCCLVPLFFGDRPRSDHQEPPVRPVEERPLGDRKVLYIGDSLSVGPFGQQLENTLIKDLGREKVWFYASCGSSVQSWLASEPVFVTPCGYRESIPKVQLLDDFHDGQKPKGMATPKIEILLADIHPDLVIVQLGTNHFDALELGGTAAVARHAKIFERFASSIRQFAPSTCAVVWISPPDCARFPEWITSSIKTLIEKTAAAHQFNVIDSRRYTRYVKGVTGGDGVHYGRDAAFKWANHVIADLHLVLPAAQHH